MTGICENRQFNPTLLDPFAKNYAETFDDT